MAEKPYVPKENRGSVPSGEVDAANVAQLNYENALLNWQPGDGPVPQAPEIQTGKAGVKTTYDGETTGHAGQSYSGDGGGGDGGQLDAGASLGVAAPPPVKYSPKPVEGPVSHANEEEDHLFGPTQRPEEHLTTGGYTPGQTVSTPPDGMSQWYAALRQASRDPEAPPRIRELWGLTNQLMNARDAAGGSPAPAPSPAPSGEMGFTDPANPSDIGGAVGVGAEDNAAPPAPEQPRPDFLTAQGERGWF